MRTLVVLGLALTLTLGCAGIWTPTTFDINGMAIGQPCHGNHSISDNHGLGILTTYVGEEVYLSHTDYHGHIEYIFVYALDADLGLVRIVRQLPGFECEVVGVGCMGTDTAGSTIVVGDAFVSISAKATPERDAGLEATRAAEAMATAGM